MTQPLAEPIEIERKRASLADVIALMKPRITFMVIITTSGGLWLSRRAGDVDLRASVVISTLLGTSLIVAGANALNMYIERDIDRNMARTKNRPLPARRMSPRFALWLGLVLSAAAVPILLLGVNALTALLAVLANMLYVLAYTPMKQRSHLALQVGAVPGAIPPLLGWTAGRGRIDTAGMVLFAILFVWQIPHFLAITLFRKTEYAKAGLVVMPNVMGDLATRHDIVRWLLPLVAASLLLVPLGVAHTGYLAVALVLGVVFFGWGLVGLRRGSNRWARSLFLASMVYLVLLFAALAIDP